MTTKDEILGTGWKFPPTFEAITGEVEMQSGIADINESIYLIIFTKLSERVMRPFFGSTIHSLIFEPLNPNLKTYMSSSLKDALEQGEPRIIIEELTLEQPDQHLGLVNIEITYRTIETNTIKNLVVPFYTDTLENTL